MTEFASYSRAYQKTGHINRIALGVVYLTVVQMLRSILYATLEYFSASICA